jgi:phage baseplate assembly protein gpV
MRRMLVAGALGVLVLLGAGCSDDGGGETAPPDDGLPTPPPVTTPQATSGTSPTVFNDEGAVGTFDCAGQDITVNGADVDVHLTGACGTVVVNGDRVRLVVDDAAIIVVNGDESEVTYSGDPEVTVNGEDSSAEEV